MDLGNGTALYWDAPDNSTHYSASAEQVLEIHERAGIAHLEWLDHPPPHTPGPTPPR